MITFVFFLKCITLLNLEQRGISGRISEAANFFSLSLSHPHPHTPWHTLACRCLVRKCQSEGLDDLNQFFPQPNVYILPSKKWQILFYPSSIVYFCFSYKYLNECLTFLVATPCSFMGFDFWIKNYLFVHYPFHLDSARGGLAIVSCLIH